MKAVQIVGISIAACALFSCSTAEPTRTRPQETPIIRIASSNAEEVISEGSSPIPSSPGSGAVVIFVDGVGDNRDLRLFVGQQMSRIAKQKGYAVYDYHGDFPAETLYGEFTGIAEYYNFGETRSIFSRKPSIAFRNDSYEASFQVRLVSTANEVVWNETCTFEKPEKNDERNNLGIDYRAVVSKVMENLPST